MAVVGAAEMVASLLRRLLQFGAWPGSGRARCKVLFVCMANYCRSPTAEAVFRHHVKRAGLARDIVCDSAGIQNFNWGGLPDARARAAAHNRGYDMSRMRGRGIRDEDFIRFDLILALDRQNLVALRERCPPDQAARLRLLMEFAPRHQTLDVPDPYFGNAQGFELALDMIEEACAELLEHVRGTHLERGLTAPTAPSD
jgi:protein-tyrosine phosphatase